MEKPFSSVDTKFWQEYALKEDNELLRVDSLETYMKILIERMDELLASPTRAIGQMAKLPPDSASPSAVKPMPSKATRDAIFISYSHKDKK
jgi:hypothetical protein